MKKKISVLLALLLLVCSMFAAPVHAETVLQNGIEVTLVTDKENYDALETVYASLTVKNTNSYDVANVTTKLSVPKGYVLTGDAETMIDLLSAGEEYQHQVAVRHENAPATALPQTGDDSHGTLWSLLFVVAVIALCVLIRNPQAKRVVSIFLCLAVVGPYVMQVVPAQAEADATEIVVKEEIPVGGKPITLTGTVTYESAVAQKGSALIIAQPTTQIVSAGATAKFTVQATGDNLTYQWYYRKSGATAWTPASSTKTTYSFTMKESFDGREIRCGVTDASGKTVYTDTVSLLLPVAKITTQPTSQVVAVGATAKFTLAATGDGLKYQWYYRKSGTTAWSTASSTTATYSFTMKASFDNRQIYCIVTDQYGNKATSKIVTLTTPTVKITTQPTNQIVAAGATAKFSLAATGDNLTYQWYYRKSGATSWSTASSKTATYSFTMKESYANREIRCKVTDANGKSVYSDTVTLTLAKLKITTQPTDQSVAVGATAKFTLAATGDGLKYQWYYRKGGTTTWSKAASTKTTYSFTMKESFANREIRCKVTDADGNSVYSNTVKLTLPALQITKQPVDTWAYEGETAKVTIEAAGDGVTYQWYYKDPSKTVFTKASNTTKSSSTKMTAARDGRQLYCVVSDAKGNTVQSNTVTLDTRFKATITSQPVSVTVKIDETAKFTVTATGDGLSYQWYYKNPGDASFSKAASTSATCSTKMTEARNGRQMYCVVTDAYGNTVQSDTVVMEKGLELTYTINAGEVTITGYEGNAARVVVPNEIEGYPVTAIGNDAFANKTTLSHITLPDSVKIIGQRAFKGCTGLASMDTH